MARCACRIARDAAPSCAAARPNDGATAAKGRGGGTRTIRVRTGLFVWQLRRSDLSWQGWWAGEGLQPTDLALIKRVLYR